MDSETEGETKWRETLCATFGFGTFRDGQEAVVRALMAGRPALAVFPTGGGKSLCYQLPALLLDGLTLVISPLIALMKDQVDALTARGVAAARLDSTLDAAALADLYQRLDAGKVRLLYVAPERLANEAFRKRLRGWKVAMVAVDEAHCIAEWGHNFRPDYLKIAAFCRRLGVKRVLALTATATPAVAREIRQRFRIAAADHLQLSFHRPNLDLRVTPCATDQRKTLLLDRLAAIDGAVVVYVTRQETAEEVATWLQGHGIRARAYHAGLPDEFRSDAQHAFMTGATRVIVATIAFGMGIDKADIRGVIHYNLPKSVENLSQEIGRAGRDGQPAVCELLACGDDLTVLENFIHGDTPTPRALANLLDRVLRLGSEFNVSLYDLSQSTDIRPSVVATALAYLETGGVIEATGTFYQTYRLKPMVPMPRILAGRPAAERRFIERLLETGTAGRIWITIEPTVAAGQLGVRRERVVATLAALEAAGDAALSIHGVRQAYRLCKEGPELREIAATLAATFARRETADLDRLHRVPAIAAGTGCLTGALSKYFGESLTRPCGHCDRCRGIPPRPILRSPARQPGEADWQVIRAIAAEGHSTLATARQLARFLCGLTSPATIRTRLTRHDAFGLLSQLPFEEVLAIAASLRS